MVVSKTKWDITLATSPGLAIIEYIVEMPIHGENGNETDGRAERSEIYQRDGNLGNELSWMMAPIYEKFDEQKAILMEQKGAMAKEAG